MPNAVDAADDTNVISGGTLNDQGLYEQPASITLNDQRIYGNAVHVNGNNYFRIPVVNPTSEQSIATTFNQHVSIATFNDREYLVAVDSDGQAEKRHYIRYDATNNQYVALSAPSDFAPTLLRPGAMTARFRPGTTGQTPEEFRTTDMADPSGPQQTTQQARDNIAYNTVFENAPISANARVESTNPAAAIMATVAEWRSQTTMPEKDEVQQILGLIESAGPDAHNILDRESRMIIAERVQYYLAHPVNNEILRASNAVITILATGTTRKDDRSYNQKTLGSTRLDAFVFDAALEAYEALIGAHPGLRDAFQNGSQLIWTEDTAANFIEEAVEAFAAIYNIAVPIITYGATGENVAIATEGINGGRGTVALGPIWFDAAAMAQKPKLLIEGISVLFHEVTHLYQKHLESQIDEFALGTPERTIGALSYLHRYLGQEIYLRNYDSIFIENHAFFVQELFILLMKAHTDPTPP